MRRPAGFVGKRIRSGLPQLELATEHCCTEELRARLRSASLAAVKLDSIG